MQRLIDYFAIVGLGDKIIPQNPELQHESILYRLDLTKTIFIYRKINY